MPQQIPLPLVDGDMIECTYCGSDIDRHDPVFVEERQGQGQRQRQDEEHVREQFCNYACLHAYIEDEELVYGASCELDWE